MFVVIIYTISLLLQEGHTFLFQEGHTSPAGQIHCPCTIFGCKVSVVSTTDSHRITCNGNGYTIKCPRPLTGAVGKLFTIQTLTHPPNLSKDYQLQHDVVWKCSTEVSPPSPQPGTIGCDNCADFNSRIVGGNEVTPNKYPFQVSLMADLRPTGLTTLDGRSFIHFCGGSIINKRYVLSAAHCVFGFLQFAETPGLETLGIAVSVGGHDICDDTSGEKIIPASIETIHCNYFGRNNPAPNDLWIIKLSEDLVWSDTIKPVCLPQSSQDTFGEREAVAIGWGATVAYDLVAPPPAPAQCILKEGKMKIFNTTDPICLNTILGCPDDKARTNMCARGEEEDGSGIAACQGDSGGPLLVNNNGKALIVGITSYAKGCAPTTGEPDVFVRVSSYLDFIMSNTADGTC